MGPTPVLGVGRISGLWRESIRTNGATAAQVPEGDGGDDVAGAATGGERVVARGTGDVPLERAAEALDAVALPVRQPVEGPPRRLVPASLDDRPDPAAARQAAHRSAAAPSVADRQVGAARPVAPAGRRSEPVVPGFKPTTSLQTPPSSGPRRLCYVVRTGSDDSTPERVGPTRAGRSGSHGDVDAAHRPRTTNPDAREPGSGAAHGGQGSAPDEHRQPSRSRRGRGGTGPAATTRPARRLSR